MDETVSSLVKILSDISCGLPESTFMEVCGTHTQSIAKYNLKSLLPPNIKLISGPGCPVCVTSDKDIESAAKLLSRKNAVIYSFGDMLRVPFSEKGDSLLKMRGLGADVRIAVSPMDAIKAAEKEKCKEIVWFAVGFETTAAHTAAAVKAAKMRGIRNFSVFSTHKTMKNALIALLSNNTKVNGLLCPGHVAAITGADEFRFVPDVLNIPGAVSGFSPEEILTAIISLMKMRRQGKNDLSNMYPSVVTDCGNKTAQALMYEIMEPCGATWRGLGEIPDSGLELRPEYCDYNAKIKFNIRPCTAKENSEGLCRCGDILRGEATPQDCPLFGKVCTEARPKGPCMVSSEGACCSAIKYGS